MDQPYEWEESKNIDPAVYQQAAKDGLLVALAFGARIPAKWARPDGTIFGGVKVEEWDGLYVSRCSGIARELTRTCLATT